MENVYFTVEVLATYAGCLFATVLITQFFKGVIPASFPTRFLSYGIALVVMNTADALLGQITISTVVLSIINAVIISLAANGGYDAVHKLYKKATTSEADVEDVE